MLPPIRVLLLAVALCASGCTRRDLNLLCESAQEAVTEPNVTRQRTRLGILIAGQVTKTGKVKTALDDIEFLDPPAKYPAFKAAVARFGYPDWNCPEFETILAAPDPMDPAPADEEDEDEVDDEAADE